MSAHDIFEKQPVENSSVFFIRYVMHNWSDKYCIKFLRRLREAATPDTRLVVMEHIMDYLCRDTEDIEAAVPGAYKPSAQEPLLPHPDTATGFGYALDMAVCRRPLICSLEGSLVIRCWA